MKDDDQILAEGGDEDEIVAYAREHGANLTEEDIDIKIGILVRDVTAVNHMIPKSAVRRRIMEICDASRKQLLDEIMEEIGKSPQGFQDSVRIIKSKYLWIK